jgi:hypothetical protein
MFEDPGEYERLLLAESAPFQGPGATSVVERIPA